MKHFIRWAGEIIGTLRAEKRQIGNRYFGKVHRFDGNARQICLQVIDELWAGDFYRTSLGHFDFFWMRDFGTVAQSLTRLGHRDKVHHTLRWALRHYRRAGIVKLCIDNKGNVFNAPGKSIDAMPWLFHSLVVSEYPLNKTEREFLGRQLRKYSRMYIDKNTGLIKKMKFGEMRDAVVYDRSAYALAMVGRLAQCVEILGMNDYYPFGVAVYRDELVSRYWNGKYFNADYSNDTFSAECALFPFYMRIVDNEVMAGKTFDYIRQQKLNYPYPLRYTNHPHKFKYHFWMSGIFMGNYQGSTIWSWHGEFYLHLLRRYKRPEYKEQYALFARMVERHGNFPEMLDNDGSWFNSLVYKGDPGMVWAALFAELPKP